MDDFGKLAEHFSEGEKIDQLHKKKQREPFEVTLLIFYPGHRHCSQTTSQGCYWVVAPFAALLSLPREPQRWLMPFEVTMIKCGVGEE